MVIGNEGPLLTCMEVEVVGAVWMVDVVPGKLVTVNAGFSASWKRRAGEENHPGLRGTSVTYPSQSPPKTKPGLEMHL